MDKIYEQAKDLHVRNFVVYGKAADKKLYYEPEFKTQVTKADAEDAFDKGALMIVDTTTKLVPIAFAGKTVKTAALSVDKLVFTEWAVA